MHRHGRSWRAPLRFELPDEPATVAETTMASWPSRTRWAAISRVPRSTPPWHGVPGGFETDFS